MTDSPVIPPQSNETILPPDPVTSETASTRKPVTSKWVLGSILVLLVFVITFTTYYVVNNFDITMSRTVPNESAIPTSSPSSQLTNNQVSSLGSSLVYIKNSSKEKTVANNELWLIDIKTQEEQKIELETVSEAYKYPDSPEVWYRPASNLDGEIHVLNIDSGKDETYIPITHPDPTTHETVSIGNLNHISPDGKWAVIGIEYFKDCPPPSPLPSGFEGGWGPCQPEENIEYPNGLHLYNRETNKLTYLDSGVIRFSRWDIKNDILYYVNSDKHVTYSLNLKTLSRQMIDSSSYFGYFTYPLLKSPALLRYEGSYDNNTFSEVALLNLSSGKKEIIDSEDSWADIQPFISASPDEGYFLLTRSPYIEPRSMGRKKDVLLSYDTQAKSKSSFKPSSENASIRPQGVWVSDTDFVTKMTLNSENYQDNVDDLVILNFKSLEIKPLTKHGDVFGFGGN